MKLPEIPPRPGVRQILLEVRGAGTRAGGAFRGALAVALPSLVGLAAGFGALAAVSALGAFAVVYGEGRPYRTRWRVVSGYGAALIACAAVGSALGGAVQTWPATVGWAGMVVLMTVVVVAAACWVDALREPAPGAFLLVLCAELACVLAAFGAVSAPGVVEWTAVGAGCAVFVSMCGALMRNDGPEIAALGRAEHALKALAHNRDDHLLARRTIHVLHEAADCLGAATPTGRRHHLADRFEALYRRCLVLVRTTADPQASDAVGVPVEQMDLMAFPRPTVVQRIRWALISPRTRILAIRLTVGCVLAGAAAIAIGLPRPDWAVITAAMILHQGPDRVLGSWRAVHRCIGTVAGVVLLAVLAPLLGSTGWLIVVVALLMAGTEAFLVINYAVALVFITPLAMILGELSAPSSLFDAAAGRIGETVLGVAVAVAALWLVIPRSYRIISVAADQHVAETITAAATSAVGAAAVNRRRLEFDLQSATTAIVQASYCDRAWTQARWAAHHRLHLRAYRLVIDHDGAL